LGEGRARDETQYLVGAPLYLPAMDSSLGASTATITLLIVTVVVSLVAFVSASLWRFLALEPYRMLRTHQYHPIITSGLIHADLIHLFVNMMTLYFFGPALESIVGGSLFVTIYFVSLIVGNLYPFIKFRHNENYVAIGASGAVSGVLFSFCLFNPFAKIYLYMAIPLPAFVFAILYVIYSVYSMRRRRDNIGHEAHLAGALGGVITTLIAVPDVIPHLIALIG
jgi:membrane associated rhomboid family serine protease